jgi:SAM-dependent methyltransferase
MHSNDKNALVVSRMGIDEIVQWLEQFGENDIPYLRTHFKRFNFTRKFALPEPKTSLAILDVGSHWLHNSIFYAGEKHKIHCVDTVMNHHPTVKLIAKSIGATLYHPAYLERGDGVKDILFDSIDIVLFCEIIEHLTFNPIPMWKEIYRVMKPAGKIIVTTPNANFWPRLADNVDRILSKRGWGVTVEQIMTQGTHGHHWKELTKSEIAEYFSFLSKDFFISKCVLANVYQFPEPGGNLPFELSDEVLHDSIFAQVTLREKTDGISVDPPW